MSEALRVVVYPSTEDSGRGVRIGDRIEGIAYTLLDITEFLRRTGQEDVEPGSGTAVRWCSAGPYRGWPAPRAVRRWAVSTRAETTARSWRSSTRGTSRSPD